MTAAEAKQMIKEEFIRKYYEWLDDEKNLSDKDYGWKYGYGKGTTQHKDNQKAVIHFQTYMFSGRWLPTWEEEGYDRKVIWQLNREGFLSYQGYSNWNARMTGRTDFYYISQKVAKEIYKEMKAAA